MTRPEGLPRRPHVAGELDYADLQGNLARGYPHGYGRYVFVRIADAARGREWLKGLQVTSAELWDAPPAETLNLAFTFGGLAALGVSSQLLATFPSFCPCRLGCVQSRII